MPSEKPTPVFLLAQQRDLEDVPFPGLSTMWVSKPRSLSSSFRKNCR